MTVAMELATALRHSAQRPKTVVEEPITRRATCYGDRRSLHRAWPGILAEPGPQRSDRSRRKSSGDTHTTLGLPVLAGALGEVVDSSALRFLTAHVLEVKRKDEEPGEEELLLEEEEDPGWF